jgi:hypothetical protein
MLILDGFLPKQIL